MLLQLGHMAIAITQMSHARKLSARIGQLVLLYPVTGTHMKTETYQTFREGPCLAEKTKDWMIEAFLPKHEDRHFPLTSPLTFASDEVLAKFPPRSLSRVQIR